MIGSDSLARTPPRKGLERGCGAGGCLTRPLSGGKPYVYEKTLLVALGGLESRETFQTVRECLTFFGVSSGLSERPTEP